MVLTMRAHGSCWHFISQKCVCVYIEQAHFYISGWYGSVFYLLNLLCRSACSWTTCPWHGQSWIQAIRTFAADLLKEILLHGRQDANQPALFHVSNNCTIVLTDMCKIAVYMHLKTANVPLKTYPRALAWFQLDEDSLKSFHSLVSLPLI